MLSTIDILSIFIKIFLASLLISGSYAFSKRYIRFSFLKDLYIFLILNFFSIATVSNVVADLVRNINLPVGILEVVINLSYVGASIFICLLASEKIAPKSVLFRISILSITASTAFLAKIYLTIFFTFPFQISFLVLSWFALGISSLIILRKITDTREINLEKISAIAAFLIGATYFVSVIASGAINQQSLLSIWTCLLFSFSFFLLGNIVSKEDDIAFSPFKFLQSRILFRLVAPSIIMIIVLVEATTIATISISKTALLNQIIETNKQIAVGLSEKINEYNADKKSKAAIIKVLGENVRKSSIFKDRALHIFDVYENLVFSNLGDGTISNINMKNTNIYIESMANDIGGMSFEDSNKISMVGAYISVPSANWRIIISQSKDKAFGDMRRVETNSLIFVMIGIVITIIVGMFFAKDVENSINLIVSGTEEIRNGNLSHKIEVNTIDELGLLAKEFNSMTAELKESQAHLISSEKLAALGTMAAGMAHEIKNPLVALRTFSQLLPIKWEDKEFRMKYSSIIPPEIEKINKIAENLLKFGRPTKPELKSANINSILEDVLDLLENQFKKNDIKISTQLAKIPDIKCDTGQISQALLNITLNAVQAMPNGGELTVKSDTGHVIMLGKGAETSGKSHKEPAIFIELTDTGSGIAEDKMKNLFDPFFTTKENGTGMGLPITLRIIEEHKGSIKVKSVLGKGTTFIIILPIENSSFQTL